MGVKDLFAADMRLIATAYASHKAAASTTFDFGTPNDINLATVVSTEPGHGYEHADRIFVVFTAVADGAVSHVSFEVEDAPDAAGAIGATAAAATDGTLTGGHDSQVAYTAVQLKPDRPWIRCKVTADDATNTFKCACMVFAVPCNV